MEPDRRVSVVISRGRNERERVIDLTLHGMEDRAEAIYRALSPFETDTEKQA